MKFSTKILSQTIVQLCFEKGITDIVISPGSRNAPLTIGFTEHPGFNCLSIVDERCAAFFALGIAQQSKKPVALVCTSGSALLNYYPAIAEAFYSDIPLVVLSADRPSEYIDIGDGQTIRQENVFENHILYSANCAEGEEFQTYNDTEINIALNTAWELNGPVHINIPFSEPLYQTTEARLVSPQNVAPRLGTEIWSEDLSHFIAQWSKSSRKMILVGQLPPNSLEQRFIDCLAADKSVLVLTETTSNLQHENFISSIDSLIENLTETELEDLRPNILLTFGGMVVSKKIKVFLRNYSPKEHWHVDVKKAYNTYFILTKHFKISINTFLSNLLLEKSSIASPYQQYWLAIKRLREQKHKSFETEVVYSDFLVYSKIFKQIPSEVQLQVSNSASIRYCQLFKAPSSVEVFCNRGTSGIDGSTSTSIGAALASNKPTILLTGDLSFFYDSNGLWNNYIPDTFKIIIVNNGGGGIFRILPGHQDNAVFDNFFETKHNLDASKIADMYGFSYFFIKNAENLEQGLNKFYNSENSRQILEIFTPSDINDKVLKEYFDFIS